MENNQLLAALMFGFMILCIILSMLVMKVIANWYRKLAELSQSKHVVLIPSILNVYNHNRN